MLSPARLELPQEAATGWARSLSRLGVSFRYVAAKARMSPRWVENERC